MKDCIQWDELHSLCVNYPIWPGDTISHASMRELKDSGYAVRDSSGEWIPTAKGIERFNAGALPGDKGVN